MPDKRTYADRAEYMIQAVTKRRKRLKQMVVEYKGGKCMLCGYNRCIQAFDLHHNSDSKKNFGLSERGLTRAWDTIKKEADKCILVCANCHREIHANYVQPPRETSGRKSGKLSGSPTLSAKRR